MFRLAGWGGMCCLVALGKSPFLPSRAPTGHSGVCVYVYQYVWKRPRPSSVFVPLRLCVDPGSVCGCTSTGVRRPGPRLCTHLHTYTWTCVLTVSTPPHVHVDCVLVRVCTMCLYVAQAPVCGYDVRVVLRTLGAGYSSQALPAIPTPSHCPVLFMVLVLGWAQNGMRKVPGVQRGRRTHLGSCEPQRGRPSEPKSGPSLNRTPR